MGRQPVAGSPVTLFCWFSKKPNRGSLYSDAISTTLRTADSEISCGAVATTAMEGLSWSRPLVSSPVLGGMSTTSTWVPDQSTSPIRRRMMQCFRISSSGSGQSAHLRSAGTPELSVEKGIAAKCIVMVYPNFKKDLEPIRAGGKLKSA